MTGRQGESQTVLTNQQVRKIREMRSVGAPQTELAELFKVSQAHISRICRGLQRREAGGPIQQKWSKA